MSEATVISNGVPYRALDDIPDRVLKLLEPHDLKLIKEDKAVILEYLPNNLRVEIADGIAIGSLRSKRLQSINRTLVVNRKNSEGWLLREKFLTIRELLQGVTRQAAHSASG